MIPGVENLDGWAARFDDAGDLRWGDVFGSPADDRVNAVGFDDDDRFYMGLSHRADVEIDPDTTLENGSGDWLTSIVALE